MEEDLTRLEGMMAVVKYLVKKDRERKAREIKEQLDMRDLIIGVETSMILALVIRLAM